MSEPAATTAVVITESTRRGIANRYTFTRRRPGEWTPELRTSRRASDELRQQSRDVARRSEAESSRPVSTFAKRQLASLGVLPYRALEPGKVVHLGAGVDMAATALVAVLEACHGANRGKIDLADIKRVMSQLGSRISQLDTLTVEQRRLVEPALYTKILQCCASVGDVSID